MNRFFLCLPLLCAGAAAQPPGLVLPPAVATAALPDASLTAGRERRLAAGRGGMAGAPAAADRSTMASPLARAMTRAARKGVIELGVEEYSEVLIQCQKAQSVVLTTPLLRSDAQQAHCYRF